MKKMFSQLVLSVCVGVCCVGMVTASGCGGPGKTPTGVDEPVDEDLTPEEEALEE